jgi:ferrous iron transport protein B
MWFLMTFPKPNHYGQDYNGLIKGAETSYLAGEITGPEKDTLVIGYENHMAAENLEYSIAGRLGRIIEPIIRPLGFDWRLGIAIISGLAAKEVVVSTMGTIYGVGKVDEGSESLRQNLATDPRYSKLIAYSFLVFILIYAPCLAAMAVFLRESGSVKEALFQFSYTILLAWGMSMVIYQGGKYLGLG